MPYIDAETKQRLDAHEWPKTPGELTYLVTMTLIEKGNGATGALYEALTKHVESFLPEEGARYKDYAVVLGCLDSARREHVRRTGYMGRVAALALSDFQNRYYNEVVAPYEDAAIAKNGDVYA